MACGCQCTCPSASNRAYQQSPNYQSMLGSKLVSKPGMSLAFLQEAITVLEIVEEDALPGGQRPAQAPR